MWLKTISVPSGKCRIHRYILRDEKFECHGDCEAGPFSYKTDGLL